MQYRIAPHRPLTIVRVADDGTEEPFLVVLDPAAAPAVVVALNAQAVALTASEKHTLPDDMADFGCPVVMTGGCRYFLDGVHRCCVAPLGEAAHGTADHPHGCLCLLRWAVVPTPETPTQES